MLLCFSWKWLSQFLFWFVFLLGEGEGGELVVFFPCAGKKKGQAAPVTVFVLSESLQLGEGKVHGFSG